MNKLVVGVAVGAMLALAGPAAATTALQFSQVGLSTTNIGQSFTLGFQAVTGPDRNKAQYSNISGAVNLQLLGVSHLGGVSTWRFMATLSNTSTAPMTSVRISTYGFSTAAAGASGANPTFLPISSVNVVTDPVAPLYESLLFTNDQRGLGIPNVANSNSPQLCLKDGGNDNNCGGGGGGGLGMRAPVQPGMPANPFPVTQTEFALAFTGPTEITALTLHNFYLRFQSLTGTGTKVSTGNYGGEGTGTPDGSGVGIVTYVGGFENGPDITPLPEPASWAMLITGFGFIGAAARRRRAIAA